MLPISPHRNHKVHIVSILVPLILVFDVLTHAPSVNPRSYSIGIYSCPDYPALQHYYVILFHRDL
jgi:hypothetical protein